MALVRVECVGRDNRHLIDDSICPCCNSATESNIHVVITCPRVQQLWVNSGCVKALELCVSGSFGEVLMAWAKDLEKEMYQKRLFLTWFIWYRRNKWVFENNLEPDVALLLRHSRLVCDFGEYTEKIYGGILQPQTPAGRMVWTPPPPNAIKLNVDASIDEAGWVGFGAIARDHSGQVLFSAVRRVKARWDVLIAECKAALFGLKKAKERGFDNIILESDSLQLVSKLKKSAFLFSDVDCILEDIISLSSCFTSIIWSHVKRDRNLIVHHLARLVPLGFEQCWDYLVPDEVAPYVLLDTLSMN
ncbi:uncharacterized protein LOC110714367 [Chenopodium quinoa]|uniref:uncharacterized protein LOC110714367 n=1 Tax=Chenopodium quinoa TaxID=63459 RepID=UPI000B77FD00|nr:uncharacterized protein LOC110714367 [Chenopodium quinoa]